MCFRRKKKKESITNTADNIIIKQLETDDDAYIIDLVDQMVLGSPLILNFDLLHVDAANKVLAFITGVIYAIDGHYQLIKDNIYLFGNKELYIDNSINKWLSDNIN